MLYNNCHVAQRTRTIFLWCIPLMHSSQLDLGLGIHLCQHLQIISARRERGKPYARRRPDRQVQLRQRRAGARGMTRNYIPLTLAISNPLTLAPLDQSRWPSEVQCARLRTLPRYLLTLTVRIWEIRSLQLAPYSSK